MPRASTPGLNALGAPPPEYLVLRATPEPWRPEDSILTVLAMFNTLQGRQALFEQTIGSMRDTLPEPLFRFLASYGSEWDTPVVGGGSVRPAIPGPDIFDLRKAAAVETPRPKTIPQNARAAKRLLSSLFVDAWVASSRP